MCLVDNDQLSNQQTEIYTYIRLTTNCPTDS